MFMPMNPEAPPSVYNSRVLRGKCYLSELKEEEANGRFSVGRNGTSFELPTKADVSIYIPNPDISNSAPDHVLKISVPNHVFQSWSRLV
jgi:hypothetical protein